MFTREDYCENIIHNFAETIIGIKRHDNDFMSALKSSVQLDNMAPYILSDIEKVEAAKLVEKIKTNPEKYVNLSEILAVALHTLKIYILPEETYNQIDPIMQIYYPNYPNKNGYRVLRLKELLSYLPYRINTVQIANGKGLTEEGNKRAHTAVYVSYLDKEC